MSTKPLNPKYAPNEQGIHRVPLWRIGGFALNNTATNLYLFFMMYVSYYLTGFVGVGTVLASSFSTIMRLWDGVTDPFVGMMVDKTNGKFGKNRPFIVVGNVILAVTSFIMFNVTHKLPENTTLRFTFFTIMSCIYYLGYTAQCVVTKSAQSAMTNDPKQRPLFAVFDSIFNSLLFTGLAIIIAAMAEKHGGFYAESLYTEMWLMTAVASAVCTVIAVIAIAPKDRPEFFGLGTATKITLKDYVDCIAHNRAIQMLIISASTDKLAAQAKTATVTICMFGVLVGNYALNGTISGILMVPNMIIIMLAVRGIASTLGQRKAMLIGSWAGMAICALQAVLWLFGDYKSMANADGSLNWSFFTIAHIGLTLLFSGANALAGSLVIPMTADCADYEVYRTGKYVPGMMGTLFSFVDKMISSAAPMIAGLLFAAVGYADKLPDVSSPYSTGLHYVTVFLAFGLIIVGLLCNVIAMKYYPLTKEKMEEIQAEINAIKLKASAQN